MVNGLSYDEWMKRVNAKIISLTGGLDTDMLPDYCYLECWRAGDNPTETAKDVLEYARDF